jgi:hypothetical protein
MMDELHSEVSEVLSNEALLSPQQMNEAAQEIVNEMSPVLNQFPLGVGLEVGATLVSTVILLLISQGQREDALQVISHLETQLDGLRSGIQYGQEEIPASTEATA